MTDYRDSIDKTDRRRQTGALATSPPGGSDSDDGSTDGSTDDSGYIDAPDDGDDGGGGGGGSTSEPNVYVRDVQISVEKNPVPGDRIFVDVMFMNNGTASGSKTVDVLLNGSVVGSVSATVGAGEGTTKSVKLSVPRAGTNTISVGGITNSFEAQEAEPNVKAVSIKVNKEPPLVMGKKAKATVTIENVGEARGAGSITVRANGALLGNITYDIPEEATQSKTFEFEVPRSEKVKITAKGAEATFKTKKPKTPDEPKVELRAAGGTNAAAITYKLDNSVNDVPAMVEVGFKPSGERRTHKLEAGERFSGSKKFEFDVTEKTEKSVCIEILDVRPVIQ